MTNIKMKYPSRGFSFLDVGSLRNVRFSFVDARSLRNMRFSFLDAGSVRNPQEVFNV